MFNLGTVIRFEVIRALKKPTFWLAIFSIPLVYGIIGGLSMMSQNQSKEQREKLAKETFAFQITDESGVASKDLVTQNRGEYAQSKDVGIEAVRTEKVEAYFYLPQDLTKDKVEIYAKDQGFAGSDRYRLVLDAILKNSGERAVSANQLAIINGTYKTDTQLYKNGAKYDRLGEMIIPGLMAAVFYFIFLLLSSRMLTSTTEEKENRVTEMILTSISARTLIVGKIISIIILGLIQLVALFTPLILAYLAIVKGKLLDTGSMPDIFQIFERVVWQPQAIIVGVLAIAAGFLMITGFVVGLGAAMPTAQEASNWFSVVVMLLISPMFVMSSLITGEHSPIVDFMSYFPLTSPFTLLIRNTLGTLELHEAIISIAILVVSSIITIWAAVRIFQFGTISYGAKVNLKALFLSKNRKKA